MFKIYDETHEELASPNRGGAVVFKIYDSRNRQMSGVFRKSDEPHWSGVLKVYDRNTFKMYDAQESPNVGGGRQCLRYVMNRNRNLIWVLVVCRLLLYVCFLLFIADCLLDFGVNIQTLKGKRRR